MFTNIWQKIMWQSAVCFILIVKHLHACSILRWHNIFEKPIRWWHDENMSNIITNLMKFKIWQYSSILSWEVAKNVRFYVLFWQVHIIKNDHIFQKIISTEEQCKHFFKFKICSKTKWIEIRWNEILLEIEWDFIGNFIKIIHSNKSI